MSTRSKSIDTLRGLAILLMFLDHVRMNFYHWPISDPMNLDTTPPSLFFTRLITHLCAPIFVFLAGLSAYIFGEKQNSIVALSLFLLKRGIFLIALELTVLSFVWKFDFSSHLLTLQVIWAIGASMISLSILIFLPRILLIFFAATICCTHNILDAYQFSTESWFRVAWLFLHERATLTPIPGIQLKIYYPLLPWIGIMILGYAVGPLFKFSYDKKRRVHILLSFGGGALLAFIGLRLLNSYGDHPWKNEETLAKSFMGFINLTKYPPSLMYTLLTLGLALTSLAWLEKQKDSAWIGFLTTYGQASLFIYILHLYFLRTLFEVMVYFFDRRHIGFLGFESLAGIWLISIIITFGIYPCAVAFVTFKNTHKEWPWLKYF